MSDQYNDGINDNEMEEESIVTLEFEDGETIDCEALGVFEVEGKDYIALAPTDESLEDIYLFGYIEEEEGYRLYDIEDDDDYQKVEDEFFRIVEEVEAAEEDNK